MDQKGISIILFYSVVCGVGAYIPHRYHFVNENKTWSEAQTYCREKYTDLATINNMEEMMKLNYTLKERTAEQAWIGLQRGDTWKWRWSLADQTFYRDGGTYSNWDSGQPDNLGGNEYCVDMAVSGDQGLWFDARCSLLLTFVCYEEKNTDTNKYIFIDESKTWLDAQTYCREKYTDLVCVRNQTENEKIRSVSQSSVVNGVWIGLYNGCWKWSDLSNSSFRLWSSDLLNNTGSTEKCAAVNMTEKKKSLTWNDEKCNKAIPFICHENKLILIKQNLSWKEALNYCRKHHHDLVSVHTEEMQLWVKEVAPNACTEQVWLGLRHTCALGFWFWVSGEMICYQHWAPGKETGLEDCSGEKRSGAVQSGGQQQWISLPQSSKLNFICSTYED